MSACRSVCSSVSQVTNMLVTKSKIADALHESIAPRMPPGSVTADLVEFSNQLNNGPSISKGSIWAHKGGIGN